jgi:hypothetical protein
MWLALSVLPATLRASREPITLAGGLCHCQTGKDWMSAHSLKFIAADSLTHSKMETYPSFLRSVVAESLNIGSQKGLQ